MDKKMKLNECAFFAGEKSFPADKFGAGNYFYWEAEKRWVDSDAGSIARASDVFYSFIPSPLEIGIASDLQFFLFASFAHSVGQTDTPQEEYADLFLTEFLPIYLEIRRGM